MKSSTSNLFRVSLLSLASVLTTPTVHAADWICTGTDIWSTASCWWEGSVPGLNDSAGAYVSTASDTTIEYSGAVNSGVQLSDVFMNNSGSGAIIFNRNLDLDLNAYLAVFGTSGRAIVNHSMGDSTFGDIVVGSQITSNSTYNLSGTASITAFGATFGNEGYGEMIQNGGTLNVLDTLSIAQVSGASGYYELNSGVLNVAGTEYVGFFGDGAFLQTGGTHNVKNLHVGRKSGTGSYVLNGGVLDVTGVVEVGTIPAAVGATTQNAHFIQNGGSLNMSTPGARLTVSASGMANGRYDLVGGSLTTSKVVNNDTFEYSGGSLNAGVENHDHFIFSGPGTRTVNGDFTNVGETIFEHTYASGTPSELTIQRTANGLTELSDGTFLDINGNLVLQDGGALAIEVGSEFFNASAVPWITVSGSADLGGDLILTDISGFMPSDGMSWLLLDSAIVNGTFTDVLFPSIEGWTWELLYGVDNVVLTGYSVVPLPAAAWLFLTGLVGLLTVSQRSSHRPDSKE